MRTSLKIYQIVFDPTSTRVVGSERACFRLKVDDGVRPAWWTNPLLPSELASICGADQERGPDPETTGISISTALLTSAAFNFHSKSDKGARRAGQPAVAKTEQRAQRVPGVDMQGLKAPMAKSITIRDEDGSLRKVEIKKFAPTHSALKKRGVKNWAGRKIQGPSVDELWDSLGLDDLFQDDKSKEG